MSRKTYANTILLCILLGALSAVLAGCSSEHGATAAPLETVSSVSVTVAQETRVPDWLKVVGTVQPVQTSQISSQMMGNIVEIRAHEGDLVKRGQILAVLDNAQPRAAMQQAEAAASAAQNGVAAADSELSLAAATLKRYQQLYEKKSVSPQEFDQINARYQSAQAQRAIAQAQHSQANAELAQTRTALGYTLIRAPFSGIVTQKMADAGTLASPGMPLFAMEDTRSYRLEVSVDESDIRLVRMGQTVPVIIDALENRPSSGKVVQIVPAADPASRSFLVKIGLPDDTRLRSGMFGRANFLRGKRNALLIPRTSIIERGNLRGIYVLGANQIAELRYVTLGRTNGSVVEVLSGLQAGESFVAAPGGREPAGKRIAAQP